MENQVQEETRGTDIKSGVLMPDNKSASASGHNRLNHENVRRMVLEAIKKHQEISFRRLVDASCKQVVLTILREAKERALNKIHTPIYKVMELAAVKTFFLRGTDELLDEKINKPAEFHDFAEGLVFHLIKRINFILPIRYLLKQHYEIALARKVEWGGDTTRVEPT